MSIEKELQEKFGIALSGAGVPNFTNGIKIAGTAVTASAAELNKLDNVTAVAADFNLIAGQAAAGLLAADFTKLAAIDSTAAELNKLNTVTAVAADFNLLAGQQAAGLAAADFTKLAALDGTAAAMNAVDGASTPGAVMRAIRVFGASAEGTYTADDIVIPAGAAVTKIEAESVAAWDSATSALLDVGIVGTLDAYIANWSAKAAAGTITAIKDLAAGGIALLGARQAAPLTIKSSITATGATSAGGITVLTIEYQFMTTTEAGYIQTLKDA